MRARFTVAHQRKQARKTSGEGLPEPSIMERFWIDLGRFPGFCGVCGVCVRGACVRACMDPLFGVRVQVPRTT